MPAARPLNNCAVLAIVRASYTIIVLDISIVITALPKIHRALDSRPPRSRGCRTPTESE
jgi:hypothetical protein